MFIFGLGYVASRLATLLRERGWDVAGTGRAGTCRFNDTARVRQSLANATHILSAVPPDRSNGGDPVMLNYGALLRGKASTATWLGYLSSTGVYGDTGGAWVDEASPTAGAAGSARVLCDSDWLAQGARVFRLSGIYGPGRSAVDRVRSGKAHRIDLPGQVFSRVHVDDIVTAVLAAIDKGAPPGPYNITDDLPTSQNAVIEEACRLLGVEPPPLRKLDDADLSPMARGFYAQNRRVANGRAKRVLRWLPRYPTYAEGLRAVLSASGAGSAAGTDLALSATAIPASASNPPVTASGVQR